MNLFNNPLALNLTRRHFFQASGFSLGATALASLQGQAAEKGGKTGINAALPETHFPGKCKNIIYLHMVGGPAQMDLRLVVGGEVRPVTLGAVGVRS